MLKNAKTKFLLINHRKIQIYDLKPVSIALSISLKLTQSAPNYLKRCLLSNLKDAILFDVSIRSERLFGLPP